MTAIELWSLWPRGERAEPPPGLVRPETLRAEIVATLVGSIGLISAVPLTTALAATLSTRLDPARIEDAHAH